MADTHNQGEDQVAVLGTGIMGSAMARNLLKAGLRTTVWDRSPAATAALSAAGALVAASLGEAVRDAPVVIAMLPTADVERGDYAPQFPLQWALKDVDLAIEAADGSTLPRLATLSRQWHAAVDAGLGRQDVSAARLALDDRH